MAIIHMKYATIVVTQKYNRFIEGCMELTRAHLASPALALPQIKNSYKEINYCVMAF